VLLILKVFRWRTYSRKSSEPFSLKIYEDESGAVERKLPEEAVVMGQRKKIKYVHEGQYVAEVEVTLVEDDTGWSPYLSIEDAYKLDDVRYALRQGDFDIAARYGRVFELRPVMHQ
jgi:hypothetical protein